MTRTNALNTGRDDLLAWARRERGVALPVRPADALLTMLALRGADRRAGVPEPTPQLLRQVLREDLPQLLCAGDDELDAVPDVLTALADRVRAAGRLNAKRHARLLAAVEDTVPGFRRAMADPANLTWHRWYASLLTADGVDADDAAAVRAWLEAHESTPHADRPALPEPLHRSDLAERTFAVRARLAELLLAAFARDTREASPAGPLLPTHSLDADRPDDALAGELEHIADELTDRWTAAGLGEAFAARHAALAPGPEALPHVALADRMLDEHLDYYGDSSVPLPPPPAVPAPDEIRDLLHAAPLPAALAAGTFDDELREVSERCGLPGPATAVWTDGTPQELVELAADVLAAQAERLPLVTGPQDAYSFDAAHLLYSLYERGGTPDSVARKISDAKDDGVPPELEDAPTPVPGDAPDAYETPSPEELSVLLGMPGRTEADRAELDAPARGLAAIVDQLAATGCVFRTGDTYGLTPLGAAVMRHVLAAGHVAAPDPDTVAGWNAAQTVAATRHWPTRLAAAALAAWAARHGGTDEAWTALLDAVSATKADDINAARTSESFALLDLAAVPATALRAALTDPVTGAAARRLLVARGESVPEDAVPLTARATVLVEELDRCWIDDMLGQVKRRDETGDTGVPRPTDIVPTTLLPAFDTAAAAWPGGAGALVEALAEADPGTSYRILDTLHAHHPERTVANAAAHAKKTAQRSLSRRRH
ncbi:hypothetical protein [Streptomyces peucetius]|uniref:Helicase XPB/Ssl2 N-terminal domain-containing protein n=1 Tax=Streptomyces peucetius TaxID=1950 RepID=A0ABY6IE71_STRPE|nr:hypothetical protein [Streptomyces peucetius]UYQ65308.1 hypothetical protein OGH68_30150 [Streptomyces peucetius]